MRSLRLQTLKETEALLSSSLSKIICESSSKELTLDKVCLKITDGEHQTPTRIPYKEIPLVTAKNVRDGFLDLGNTDFVEKATAEKCWNRCKPEHNDILMVCVGATTGRVCCVQNPPSMVIVRSVALLRPNQEILMPEFLEYALKTSYCQNQIWSKVKQAAQPCLYIGKMKTISIPIPPLSEQKRIVEYLDRLQSKIEIMKKEREKALEETEALLPSILDKAFKGEL